MVGKNNNYSSCSTISDKDIIILYTTVKSSLDYIVRRLSDLNIPAGADPWGGR